MKTIKLIIKTVIFALLASSVIIAQNIDSDQLSMVENDATFNSNFKQINTDTLPIFKTNLNLVAWPNPTSDILYLDKGESDMLFIRVFSCEGKALFSFRTWDQISELDFSKYARAYYILNVSNGIYSNTLKIWKK